MVKKPIQDALEGGIDAVEREAKNLCPWLPDPHKCDCGAYCDATEAFVESQAMVMRIWECGECGARYYRNRE